MPAVIFNQAPDCFNQEGAVLGHEIMIKPAHKNNGFASVLMESGSCYFLGASELLQTISCGLNGSVNICIG